MSSLYLPYVNIALDTFALVVALIILATCINEFSTKRIGSRHFLIFQLSVVVALTADMIGWFGEGHPSLSLMTLAANTVMACACRIVQYKPKRQRSSPAFCVEGGTRWKRKIIIFEKHLCFLL